ncbi:alpha/beta fold hydrolase [Nakamurella flava]|uniref:Alpha/beta fold hydrolase n=1 Tax=Nakamurella flava TaxID=2576308 RepID=A0A4U6QM08_9ACTN|nr:alpha/beta fold hydrolase [Nakamurella flava]TKV61620.1 alpha/beta fold hydrolase [Nakamurella flava]
MTRGSSRSSTHPAALPPSGLPGLDPRWSRLVPVDLADGRRTFHVLDTGPVADQVGTVLCVHGNPTWSYLWRRLLADPPPGWRVVALDHLGMGYSERPAVPRTLAQRVDDLGALTAALHLSGPVVTLAHDWGGILSLGWAERHREQLAGVVLTNTAVHQPTTSKGPWLIRAAHVPALTELTCRRTPLFVRATTLINPPRAEKSIRDAYAAPYRTVADRRAVGDFVADIPFAPGHPSRPALDGIAGAVRELDVPALLLWGPRDPVFLDEHLHDLRERLPQAGVHRFETAGHLLPEDAPEYVAAVHRFVASLPGAGSVPPPAPADPGAAESAGLIALRRRREDSSPAVVEVGGRTLSWAQLAEQVEAAAAVLTRLGVRAGDRVALLVPPSLELTVALYAVWRVGAAIVVVDKGLGLRAMGTALRAAHVDHLIAESAGLVAAAPLRVPGTRIAVRAVPAAVRRLTGAVGPLLDGAPVSSPTPAVEVHPDAEAAVLFTSGATGPAKGVLYRQREVAAQLAVIRSTYDLGADDRIVAAFAPFALYGPALGIASAVPDVDVTKPGTLTAVKLAEAARAIDATVVFASPAALVNVLATADALTPADRDALGRVRLLMSAGAPVPVALLARLQALLPAASLHTPYGMTEALPLTDVSLDQIRAAGAGDGVCVGTPLAGVRVAVAPLDAAGEPAAELTDAPGVTGEIWASAPHQRARYDTRWLLDRAADAHPGWHRTGDVGQFDPDGRLWVQGRLVHVITTVDGPVTPVGVEVRTQQALPAGPLVAAVGVGPRGTQQLVVVVQDGTAPKAGALADTATQDAVRAVADHPVAAVLLCRALPVDIRHNSKIDRVAVARWAADVLGGDR